MGRIKTTQVKTLGKEFLEKYPDKFNEEFDNNKSVLNEADVDSKWLRNRLAGYITRLKRQK